MKIGVLAVQGAFIEHRKMLESLGAECVEIRQKADLEGIQGIVLPGGESTVQGKLLHKLENLLALARMESRDNAAEALAQIEARAYDAGATESGAGSLRYGIAFSGKSLAVAADRRPS